MQKLIVLFAAILICGASAFAQPGGGNRGGGGQRLMEMFQQMKDSLQLTSAQEDSVKAIYMENAPKQREIMQNQDLSREQKREAMRAVTEARNKRLKAVLSEDQMKKFLEMEERRRNRMGGGRGQGNRK